MSDKKLDPDQEKMADSYKDMKSHRKDARSGYIRRNIGKLCHLELARGAPVKGIIKAFDEQYGQLSLEVNDGDERGDSLIFVNIRYVTRMEIFKKGN